MMLYIFLSTVFVFAKAQPEECTLSGACSTDPDVCQYNMDTTTNTVTGQCCTPRTMGACTLENAPVCCEGNVEYTTQCSADLECASYCTDGECPQICSESANNQCSVDGDICRYEALVDESGICCTVTDGMCTLDYDPKCCEGITYSNQCAADLACGNYCIDGECCGGTENKQCSTDGDQCLFENETDKYGICCTPNVNSMCTLEYDPKCCEGTTYGNQCAADLACGSYCIDGECCGGTENTQCSTDGDICLFENETDKYGICCTPDINSMCTLEYDPKCCEGTTYGNQCAADLACANYCIDGECCGGTEDKQCSVDGDICRYEAVGDESGICCTVITDGICTLEYDPKCCDGITYGNQCAADLACGNYCIDGECPSDTTTTQADDESCEISCNEGINDVCNPFVRDFDDDNTEEEVCQYCFEHQKRCETMILNGKYQWRGTAYEEQCFIDYCSQRNTDIDGCTNIGIDLTVDLETECSCGIFICNDFQNSNACSFGIWIGIAFVAMLSWI